ncbi:hypothetical protein ACJIZ3_009632 [Penstemon smallii]|uniref:Protein BRANCHLESS TRICHOME n=1 Tax=Penstemon smallii TaxID=265156 RepID=A0ABD3TE65_9LAMI
MEEMMMVMMKIRSNETSSRSNIPLSTNPTWKLYENPFYISHNQKQNHHLLHNHQQQQQQQSNSDEKQIHRLHLPISTRKIAASFWDLSFIKPVMESELELARAQISELKAEMEREQKARKKMESLNKRLANELSEEKKGREALERVCQELAKEISSDKTEMNRIRKEIEEERKMLHVAEVIREERVHMKLAEAKLLMEEKFSEMGIEPYVQKKENNINNAFSFGEKLRFVLGEKRPTVTNSDHINTMALMKKRGSENPHIKRGIKGFVEFPKVVRAIGCTSSKSKLECQKGQLKILLKQKGPVRFNGLIAS